MKELLLFSLLKLGFVVSFVIWFINFTISRDGEEFFEIMKDDLDTIQQQELDYIHSAGGDVEY